MKDLDKTQVYDLRGITEEQAKELVEWIKANGEGWEHFNYDWVFEYISLGHSDSEWVYGDSEPTTHISTLFEKSYKEQLKEAKKQLEHYKKEVERLESEIKPKVGGVFKFWDSIESNFVIGTLTGIIGGDFTYLVGRTARFKNAKKLTEKEVIDLLFKKP